MISLNVFYQAADLNLCNCGFDYLIFAGCQLASRFSADKPEDSQLLLLQSDYLQSTIDFSFDKGQVNILVALTLTADDFLWVCRLFFNHERLTLPRLLPFNEASLQIMQNH